MVSTMRFALWKIYMLELTLQGRVPSKKNAWKARARGKHYLPSQIQADIDALVIQAQAKRHTLDLKPLAGARIRVSATFYVQDEHIDLDNAFTTLLDVLQKAGIIPNDRYVRSFRVDEVVQKGAPEDVHIRIEPLPVDNHGSL